MQNQPVREGGGKENETVPYKIKMVYARSETDAKWNTKLLEPDTRGSLLRN